MKYKIVQGRLFVEVSWKEPIPAGSLHSLEDGALHPIFNEETIGMTPSEFSSDRKFYKFVAYIDENFNCANCEHWTKSMYTYGKCHEISSEIDIEVTAGWDGGFVSSVETEDTFFCAAFSPKEQ